MKKLGIGYEDYKRFIDDDMYLVDKTLLIRDVLEKGGSVTLFTRPRRFGKTLALSMLRTFFELEYDREGRPIDKRRYFEGMRIWDTGDDILSKMGQYPVINLTLKSAKQPRFISAVLKLREEIIREFSRHDYLMKSEVLSEVEIEAFRKILRAGMEWNEKSGLPQSDEERKSDFLAECDKYSTSLKMLSEYLSKHHGKKVIILLDEYDVPLENAYYSGFYLEMVDFIRSLFESAFKTNDSLEFAVVTGCLRISKESIFTGLNNFQIISVLSEQFTEGFGFTQEETEEMLAEYGLSDKVEEVRDWYDGYLFGDTEIYNPWSVIQYVYDHVPNHDKLPKPYWSNTSSNSIIKDLVYEADETVKEELDLLIKGGTIEKQVHEDITYDDIHESKDNLWNFLFFTGYMRKESERAEANRILMTMRIPNIEISLIYQDQISSWFEGIAKKADRSSLYKAIRERDCEKMGDYLTDLLEQSISTFDSRESFFHGFFLSLLYGFPRYRVKSNREEGAGRPDIVLFPNRPADPAYIFELKVRKKFNEMAGGLEEAYKQIRERKYEEGILDEGYAGAISFGVCFCKKSCIVGVME